MNLHYQLKTYHYTIYQYVTVSRHREDDMSADDVRLQTEEAVSLIAGITVAIVNLLCGTTHSLLGRPTRAVTAWHCRRAQRFALEE
jgi:hypothetical protein